MPVTQEREKMVTPSGGSGRGGENGWSRGSLSETKPAGFPDGVDAG